MSRLVSWARPACELLWHTGVPCPVECEPKGEKISRFALPSAYCNDVHDMRFFMATGTAAMSVIWHLFVAACLCKVATTTYATVAWCKQFLCLLMSRRALAAFLLSQHHSKRGSKKLHKCPRVRAMPPRKLPTCRPTKQPKEPQSGGDTWRNCTSHFQPWQAESNQAVQPK